MGQNPATVVEIIWPTMKLLFLADVAIKKQNDETFLELPGIESTAILLSPGGTKEKQYFFMYQWTSDLTLPKRGVSPREKNIY